MDWTGWVEHVFSRIAARWRENEESQREGVPLAAETLAPDLSSRCPPDDLFAALVEAYIDLEWLGVVADPEHHDPTMIQATPLGQLALLNGLSAATLPGVRANCRRLSSDQRRFLLALVDASRASTDLGFPPRWKWRATDQIALQAFGGTKATDEDVAMADNIACQLWGEGLVVREGRTALQQEGYPQMFVTPLYAGFVCARMDVSAY